MRTGFSMEDSTIQLNYQIPSSNFPQILIFYMQSIPKQPLISCQKLVRLISVIPYFPPSSWCVKHQRVWNWRCCLSQGNWMASVLRPWFPPSSGNSLSKECTHHAIPTCLCTFPSKDFLKQMLPFHEKPLDAGPQRIDHAVPDFAFRGTKSSSTDGFSIGILGHSVHRHKHMPT